MDKDLIRAFYVLYGSKEIGDYNSFISRLGTTEGRKLVYDKYVKGKDGFQYISDFNDFESSLLKKKEDTGSQTSGEEQKTSSPTWAPEGEYKIAGKGVERVTDNQVAQQKPSDKKVEEAGIPPAPQKTTQQPPASGLDPRLEKQYQASLMPKQKVEGNVESPIKLPVQPKQSEEFILPLTAEADQKFQETKKKNEVIRINENSPNVSSFGIGGLGTMVSSENAEELSDKLQKESEKWKTDEEKELGRFMIIGENHSDWVSEEKDKAITKYKGDEYKFGDSKKKYDVLDAIEKGDYAELKKLSDRYGYDFVMDVRSDIDKKIEAVNDEKRMQVKAQNFVQKSYEDVVKDAGGYNYDDAKKEITSIMSKAKPTEFGVALTTKDNQRLQYLKAITNFQDAEKIEDNEERRKIQANAIAEMYRSMINSEGYLKYSQPLSINEKTLALQTARDMWHNYEVKRTTDKEFDDVVRESGMVSFNDILSAYQNEAKVFAQKDQEYMKQLETAVGNGKLSLDEAKRMLNEERTTAEAQLQSKYPMIVVDGEKIGFDENSEYVKKLNEIYEGLYKKNSGDIAQQTSVKGNFDYILKRGLSGSLTGRLYQLLSGDIMFDMSNYDAPKLAEVAGDVLAVAADAPMFAVGGAIGRGAAGVALKGLAKTGMAERIFIERSLLNSAKIVEDMLIENGVSLSSARYASKGAVAGLLAQSKFAPKFASAMQSGFALGTYSGVSDALAQKENSLDDINIWHSLKHGGIDFILGYELGLLNYGTARFKNSLNRSIKEPLKKVSVGLGISTGAFIGETAIFAGQGNIMRGDEMSAQSFIDMGVFLLGLKMQQGLVKIPSLYESKNFTKNKAGKGVFEAGFSDYEMSVLKEKGIGTKEKDIIETLRFDSKKAIDLMLDESLSLRAKQKIFWATTGRALESSAIPKESVIKEKDGKIIVELKDEEGSVVDGIIFKDIESATEGIKMIDAEIEMQQLMRKYNNVDDVGRVRIRAELEKQGVGINEVSDALQVKKEERTDTQKKAIELFDKISTQTAKDREKENEEELKVLYDEYETLKQDSLKLSEETPSSRQIADVLNKKVLLELKILSLGGKIENPFSKEYASALREKMGVRAGIEEHLASVSKYYEFKNQPEGADSQYKVISEPVFVRDKMGGTILAKKGEVEFIKREAEPVVEEPVKEDVIEPGKEPVKQAEPVEEAKTLADLSEITDKDVADVAEFLEVDIKEEGAKVEPEIKVEPEVKVEPKVETKPKLTNKKEKVAEPKVESVEPPKQTTKDTKDSTVKLNEKGETISVTPKNSKGYKQALMEVGGLKEEEAATDTVLFDIFATREAGRTKRTPQQVYESYEITKEGTVNAKTGDSLEKDRLEAGVNIEDMGRVEDPRKLFQLSNKARTEYTDLLKKKRPDLVEMGLVESVIKSVEDFSDANGNNKKLEKLAFHWTLKGNVILPEDGEKIILAEKIASKKGIDPFAYDNPNQIIESNADVTVKEKADPKTMKHFSNGKTYENNVEIFDVEDSKEGQADARRIIDTHWGEDSNPWCLLYKDPETGELRPESWEHWSKTYSGDKKIAFQNGKLIAFYADGKWWNRMDKSSDYILMIKKIPNDKLGRSEEIEYDYESGKYGEIIRVYKGDENSKNGKYEEWYPGGVKKIEHTIEDGFPVDAKEWYKNGQLAYSGKVRDGVPDGTIEEWYANGNRKSIQIYKNGTSVLDKEWIEDGTLFLERIHKPNMNGSYIEKQYEVFDKRILYEENYRGYKLNGIQKYYNYTGYVVTAEFNKGKLDPDSVKVHYSDGKLNKEISEDVRKRVNREYVEYEAEDMPFRIIASMAYERIRLAQNSQKGGVKGWVEFERTPEGTAVKKVLVGLEKADASTPIHETISHPYLEARLLEAKSGNAESKAIMSDVLKSYNAKTGKRLTVATLSNKENYRNVHEYFASEFENYTKNGMKASTPKLQKVFDKLAEWFRQIFKSAEKVNTDPRLERVFKDMFGEESFEKIKAEIEVEAKKEEIIPAEPVEEKAPAKEKKEPITSARKEQVKIRLRRDAVIGNTKMSDKSKMEVFSNMMDLIAQEKAKIKEDKKYASSEDKRNLELLESVIKGDIVAYRDKPKDVDRVMKASTEPLPEINIESITTEKEAEKAIKELESRKAKYNELFDKTYFKHQKRLSTSEVEEMKSVSPVPEINKNLDLLNKRLAELQAGTSERKAAEMAARSETAKTQKTQKSDEVIIKSPKPVKSVKKGDAVYINVPRTYADKEGSGQIKATVIGTERTKGREGAVGDKYIWVQWRAHDGTLKHGKFSPEFVFSERNTLFKEPENKRAEVIKEAESLGLDPDNYKSETALTWAIERVMIKRAMGEDKSFGNALPDRLYQSVADANEAASESKSKDNKTLRILYDRSLTKAVDSINEILISQAKKEGVSIEKWKQTLRDKFEDTDVTTAWWMNRTLNQEKIELRKVFAVKALIEKAMKEVLTGEKAVIKDQDLAMFYTMAKRAGRDIKDVYDMKNIRKELADSAKAKNKEFVSFAKERIDFVINMVNSLIKEAGIDKYYKREMRIALSRLKRASDVKRLNDLFNKEYITSFEVYDIVNNAVNVATENLAMKKLIRESGVYDTVKNIVNNPADFITPEGEKITNKEIYDYISNLFSISDIEAKVLIDEYHSVSEKMKKLDVKELTEDVFDNSYVSYDDIVERIARDLGLGKIGKLKKERDKLSKELDGADKRKKYSINEKITKIDESIAELESKSYDIEKVNEIKKKISEANQEYKQADSDKKRMEAKEKIKKLQGELSDEAGADRGLMEAKKYYAEYKKVEKASKYLDNAISDIIDIVEDMKTRKMYEGLGKVREEARKKTGHKTGFFLMYNELAKAVAGINPRFILDDAAREKKGYSPVSEDMKAKYLELLYYMADGAKTKLPFGHYRDMYDFVNELKREWYESVQAKEEAKEFAREEEHFEFIKELDESTPSLKKGSEDVRDTAVVMRKIAEEYDLSLEESGNILAEYDNLMKSKENIIKDKERLIGDPEAQAKYIENLKRRHDSEVDQRQSIKDKYGFEDAEIDEFYKAYEEIKGERVKEIMEQIKDFVESDDFFETVISEREQRSFGYLKKASADILSELTFRELDKLETAIFKKGQDVQEQAIEKIVKKVIIKMNRPKSTGEITRQVKKEINAKNSLSDVSSFVKTFGMTILRRMSRLFKGQFGVDLERNTFGELANADTLQKRDTNDTLDKFTPIENKAVKETKSQMKREKIKGVGSAHYFSSIKIGMYMIEKQAQANDIARLKEVLEATRASGLEGAFSDYIPLKLGEGETLQRIYDLIPKQGGEINLDSFYNWLTPSERKIIDFMDNYYNESYHKLMYVEGAFRGGNLDRHLEYQHLRTLKEKKNSEDSVSEMMYEGTMSSAQAKASKRRTTDKAKPVDFSGYDTFRAYVREVNRDYYLSPAIYYAKNYIREVKKGTDPDTYAVLTGYEKTLMSVIDANLKSEMRDQDTGLKILDAIEAHAYATLLTRLPRLPSEFLSNIPAVMGGRMPEFIDGIKYMYAYKGLFKDNANASLKFLMESEGSSHARRGYGKSQEYKDVMERTDPSRRRFARTKSEAVADWLMTNKLAKAKFLASKGIVGMSDIPFVRPLWIGSFAREFEKNSGKRFDIAAYNDDPKYRIDNIVDIDKARAKADNIVSEQLNSMSRYETILKIANMTPDEKRNLWNRSNYLLFSFGKNEHDTMMSFIDSMFSKNTREQNDTTVIKGLFGASGIVARQLLYTNLMTMGAMATRIVVGAVMGNSEDTDDDWDRFATRYTNDNYTDGLLQDVKKSIFMLKFGAYPVIIPRVIYGLAAQQFNEIAINWTRELEPAMKSDAIVQSGDITKTVNIGTKIFGASGYYLSEIINAYGEIEEAVRSKRMSADAGLATTALIMELGSPLGVDISNIMKTIVKNLKYTASKGVEEGLTWTQYIKKKEDFVKEDKSSFVHFDKDYKLDKSSWKSYQFKEFAFTRIYNTNAIKKENGEYKYEIDYNDKLLYYMTKPISTIKSETVTRPNQEKVEYLMSQYRNALWRNEKGNEIKGLVLSEGKSDQERSDEFFAAIRKYWDAAYAVSTMEGSKLGIGYSPSSNRLVGGDNSSAMPISNDVMDMFRKAANEYIKEEKYNVKINTRPRVK